MGGKLMGVFDEITNLFHKKPKLRKYLSCEYIEHGMNVDYDCIRLCCFNCHEGGGRQVLIDKYNGETIDWTKFFKEKKKMRELCAKGQIPERCKGCFFLKEREWDDEDYLSWIVFNHWTQCNCKCVYCFTYGATDYYTKRENFNMLPQIINLAKKGKLRGGGEIGFGGGEPAILKEFDPLVNLLLDNGCDNIRVHSSGIKYSKAIERGVNEGKLIVAVSVDSSSKEIYEKIKQVPTYDAVWKNIRAYAASQGENKYKAKTKYIIMPGINDIDEEYKRWIDMSCEAGVRSIIIDIEGAWYQTNKHNIPEHIYEMIEYGESYAKSLGMDNIELYDRARDAMVHRYDR